MNCWMVVEYAVVGFIGQELPEFVAIGQGDLINQFLLPYMVLKLILICPALAFLVVTRMAPAAPFTPKTAREEGSFRISTLDLVRVNKVHIIAENTVNDVDWFDTTQTDRTADTDVRGRTRRCVVDDIQTGDFDCRDASGLVLGWDARLLPLTLATEPVRSLWRRYHNRSPLLLLIFSREFQANVND